MSIAGLGAVAGGFAEGIERGQRIDANNMRITRERKQMQREDDETAAIDAANAAARDVLKRHEADWKKQQPGPTLDGSPVPVNPFKPSPTMILDAGKARTDKLLELRGPTESWAKAWATDEAMRGQFRQQAGQRVKAAMAGGGDLTQPVSEFFSTINDGFDVASVKPTRGLDGKTTLAIQRVNRYTGQAEPQPLMLPADQFARDIDMLAANPVDLAKHSLAMNLEAFKAAGATNLENKRQEGRMTLADVNNKSAEKRVERSATATEKAAEVRAGASSKSATAEEIRALGQERTSVDNDIRTLTQQLKDARPTDRPQIQSDLAEARKRAEDVRNRLRSLSSGGAATPEASPQGSKMDAIMKDAEAQGLSTFDVQVDGKPRVSVSRGGAAAKAAPIKALPAGAKQIGTSGGKPVYQTPDGKRFIQE